MLVCRTKQTRTKPLARSIQTSDWSLIVTDGLPQLLVMFFLQRTRWILIISSRDRLKLLSLLLLYIIIIIIVIIIIIIKPDVRGTGISHSGNPADCLNEEK